MSVLANVMEVRAQEHNCSDQSTMLHTLLYDRAMQVDELWDSKEAGCLSDMMAAI